MNQLSLLSNTPIARNTDPVTSHLSAIQITAEGSRGDQQHRAYEAVLTFPGLTSAELSHHSELDRYQMARRLPELEHEGLVFKGWIRKCSVTGRKALTWFPKKEDMLCL